MGFKEESVTTSNQKQSQSHVCMNSCNITLKKTILGRPMMYDFIFIYMCVL